MKKNHTKIERYYFCDESHLQTSIILIDLIDACNLACTTCVRGLRYMKNTKNIMDFYLFKHIIDKAVSLGFRFFSLYNWSEPFLCKELEIFTKYTKSQGIFCELSSNLSFPHFSHIIPALKFTDRLVVSLSGFTNDIYKINHRGGNFEFVKENLRKIARAKNDGIISTDVVIRYFIFDYTEFEFPLFESFASDIGLKIVRWQGYGRPNILQNAYQQRTEQNWLMDNRITQRLPRYNSTLETRMQKICNVAVQPVPLNYKGDVSLCCIKPAFPSTTVGNFLKDDLYALTWWHPMYE